MMSAQTLTQIRFVGLGLAGLICASYSGLALAWDTPQPFSPWLPGAAGVAASLMIWISVFAAGRRNTEIAMDELYRQEWSRAVQFSYWMGIVLFIIAAVMIAREMVGQTTGFAAFGTAYGATPMLAFCVITLRS